MFGTWRHLRYIWWIIYIIVYFKTLTEASMVISDLLYRAQIL